MAFEQGTERLTCPACAVQHNAKWSRMPVRDRTVIKCQACGDTLYEGNTVRDYDEVKLIAS